MLPDEFYLCLHSGHAVHGYEEEAYLGTWAPGGATGEKVQVVMWAGWGSLEPGEMLHTLQTLHYGVVRVRGGQESDRWVVAEFAGEHSVVEALFVAAQVRRVALKVAEATLMFSFSGPMAGIGADGMTVSARASSPYEADREGGSGRLFVEGSQDVPAAQLYAALMEKVKSTPEMRGLVEFYPIDEPAANRDKAMRMASGGEMFMGKFNGTQLCMRNGTVLTLQLRPGQAAERAPQSLSQNGSVVVEIITGGFVHTRGEALSNQRWLEVPGNANRAIGAVEELLSKRTELAVLVGDGLTFRGAEDKDGWPRCELHLTAEGGKVFVGLAAEGRRGFAMRKENMHHEALVWETVVRAESGNRHTKLTVSLKHGSRRQAEADWPEEYTQARAALYQFHGDTGAGRGPRMGGARGGRPGMFGYSAWTRGADLRRQGRGGWAQQRPPQPWEDRVEQGIRQLQKTAEDGFKQAEALAKQAEANADLRQQEIQTHTSQEHAETGKQVAREGEMTRQEVMDKSAMLVQGFTSSMGALAELTGSIQTQVRAAQAQGSGGQTGFQLVSTGAGRSGAGFGAMEGTGRPLGGQAQSPHTPSPGAAVNLGFSSISQVALQEHEMRVREEVERRRQLGFFQVWAIGTPHGRGHDHASCGQLMDGQVARGGDGDTDRRALATDARGGVLVGSQRGATDTHRAEWPMRGGYPAKLGSPSREVWRYGELSPGLRRVHTCSRDGGREGEPGGSPEHSEIADMGEELVEGCVEQQGACGGTTMQGWKGGADEPGVISFWAGGVEPGEDRGVDVTGGRAPAGQAGGPTLAFRAGDGWIGDSHWAARETITQNQTKNSNMYSERVSKGGAGGVPRAGVSKRMGAGGGQPHREGHTSTPPTYAFAHPLGAAGARTEHARMWRGGVEGRQWMGGGDRLGGDTHENATGGADDRELLDFEVERAVMHRYGLGIEAAEVRVATATIGVERRAAARLSMGRVDDDRRLMVVCDGAHFRVVFAVRTTAYIFDPLGPESARAIWDTVWPRVLREGGGV